MAYTAVKLADVQKAIAAVTAAQKKYTDAQANTKTTQTAVTTAQKALDTARTNLEKLQSAFDDQSYLTKNTGYTNAQKASSTAEKKLNDARTFLDSGQFLEKNTTYQNALKAITTAEKNRDTAQRNLDSATDKNRASLEKALATANKAVDTAYTSADKARSAAEKAAQTSISTAEKSYNTSLTALDNARSAAEKAYQTGTIKPAQTTLDKANATFETAQSKYQGLIDSIQPLLDQKNDAINNVGNYINDIKGSLGDVTKMADVTSVKTLLSQIQTAVGNTKLNELINPVKSMISEIDPLKMANIPQVNLPKANPDYFSNVDQNTGLPMLDQGALDSVLDKYKSNSLTSDQYRDNYDKFGWNVKSDGSSVARGAAIFGLEKTTSPMGSGVTYSGDFNKAAKQAGVDISGLKTNEEKYNAINEATKDFYVVANALDRTGISANQKAPHAAILFKADGSGNLIPVTKQDGSLAANYYDAVGVSHAGWKGQLAELAPVVSIASMAFLPGIGQALSAEIGTGLTALGASEAAAATLAPVLSSAAISGGLAAITGGDVLKSAVSGAVTSGALQNAEGVANATIGESNVAAIAQATGMTRDQVAKIISNGISSGLTASLQGKDALDVMKNNILSNIAGTEAKNYVGQILSSVDGISSEALAKAADAAGSIAKVGTQALASGQDLSTALTNAAPSIAGGLLKGAPVVEKGIYAPVTAALGEDQVGAMTPAGVTGGITSKDLTVPGSEAGTIYPPWAVTDEGLGTSTIEDQAAAGALSSVFGQPTPSATQPGGLSSAYAGADMADIYGIPSGGSLMGGLPSTSTDIRSLPAVTVYGTPEGTADDYSSVVGTGASGFPLTDQTKVQENLTSMGLDPALAKVVAQNVMGKPASALNAWYAVLAEQAKKKYVPMEAPESTVMMTPEQLQARGFPVQPQPAQPQFYCRGGLASIKG